MSSMTTLGINFSSLACILAVTKFLAVEAAQWVWNIYFNRYAEVTDFDMLRNWSCLKCDYESVCISSATRVVLSEYVVDVSNTLWLEFIKYFFLFTIDKGPTSDDTFTATTNLMFCVDWLWQDSQPNCPICWGRGNFDKQITFAEASDCSYITHCAFDSFVYSKWRKLWQWSVVIHWLDDKPSVIMSIFVFIIHIRICLRCWGNSSIFHIWCEIFNTLAPHHHGVPTVLLPERGTRRMGHSPASYSYGEYKGVIAEWRGASEGHAELKRSVAT